MARAAREGSTMQKKGERGQAIVLVVLATCLVLIGGIGLAMDVSQLYGQRHMAQVAADAAALGAIMSIFDKTNTGTNAFGTPPTPASFTCTVSTDARTPCQYARQNGFDTTSSDGVDVSFPTSVPGVSLSSDYPTNIVKVTISRTVNNWFIKLIGGGPTTVVKATATAAIVDVVAPVPIIVLHPTQSGSFQKNGSNTITICGGPSRSIQVNSNSGTSISISGASGTVDLSHAGPLDLLGDCSAGTGADFGNYAPGPPPQTTYPGTILLGTKPGKYIQPSSPIGDPLINVPEPTLPLISAVAPTPVLPGVGDCPSSVSNPCQLYQPGRYDGGIGNAALPGKIPNNTLALFNPGVYYLNNGGFHLGSNTAVHMATAATPGYLADAVTGSGAVFFSAGNLANDFFEITSNSGKITGVNYGNILVGAPGGSVYKGILFFEKRDAAAHSHNLQGGGGLSVTGTIYLTNTVPTMTATPAHYQSLTLQGTPGSSTTIIGEIIVDTLSLGGNAGIMMNLNPAATLHIPQVALVN